MDTIKNRKVISLLIGATLGFLILKLSSFFTGAIEPWDAERNPRYYFSALFLSGFLASIPYPNQYLTATLGIFLGQICFILLFLYGPLFGVSILITALYTLAALLGAWISQKMLANKDTEGG